MAPSAITPNFALNLSEDGISLLHRAANGAGWVEVGRVPLDTADLGAELGALRKKAEAIEGPGFATKLILPPSQLLYATIAVENDLHADVAQALEDRTPYSADQLSYDISGTPPEVQVVAVARETLTEAEGFIGPYGFNPVGFTAVPDPDHFAGEPVLGAMPGSGAEFVADAVAVKVISAEEAAVMPPAPEPEPEAMAEPEPDTEPVREAEPESKAQKETQPEPASELSSEPTSEQKPDPAPEPDTKADAAPEPEAEPDPEPDAEPEPEPNTPEASAPAASPAAFSSRRRPTLGPAKDAGDLVTTRAPRIALPMTDAPKPTAEKSRKPPRVEPRIKVGEAAKTKPAPPIVPASATATATKTKPPEKSPSRMAAGLSAMKERKAAQKKSKAQSASARPDPIAELAARQAAGKPRFLGLILTAILLVVLLLFAALSSYLLPEETVARLLGRAVPDAAQTQAAEQVPDLPADPVQEQFAALPGPDVPIFTIPSPEEIAEAETPEPELPAAPARMTETEAQTAYAVSGIWQLPPEQRPIAGEEDLDTLYEVSLDPELDFEDAPALASFDVSDTALAFEVPASPPAAAILFSLDARGLVTPSPEGALNPDGILVFSGPPPVTAVPRPDGIAPVLDPDAPAPADTTEAVTEAEGDDPAVVDPRLAAIRPNLRPDDLQERVERANQGGRTTSELSAIRPQQRPQSAIEQAQAEAIAAALAEAEEGAQEAEAIAAAQAALDQPTAQAVARSTRPSTRPGNFAQLVARAEQTRNPAAAASTASASARATGPAVARASRASPTGTTRASVARAATDNNAISLGRVALVGVFGTTSNRRALVRMPNGRFKKVSVGDRVDGGRVAAIGEGQLKYTKGGRTLTLAMPKG